MVECAIILLLLFIILYLINMMMKACGVHKLGWVLVLVGALNWGLVGAFNFNLVNVIFGSWSVVERVIYVLVGLSAVAMLLKGSCKGCKQCMGEGEMKK